MYAMYVLNKYRYEYQSDFIAYYTVICILTRDPR